MMTGQIKYHDMPRIFKTQLLITGKLKQAKRILEK